MMTFSVMTISIITQHNDFKHNVTKHNDIKYNGTLHNDINIMAIIIMTHCIPTFYIVTLGTIAFSIMPLSIMAIIKMTHIITKPAK